MACRGVHFAIEPDAVERLASAKGNDAVLSIVSDVEELWDEEWLCETDKAWDAIQRCLTGGSLDTQPEPYPLAPCVLGGQQLYRPESEYSRSYFVCLVDARQVPDVARAMEDLSEQEMRTRYLALDPQQYDGPMGEDDWQYTWSYFTALRAFYQKAADAGRAVLFTVDQ